MNDFVIIFDGHSVTRCPSQPIGRQVKMRAKWNAYESERDQAIRSTDEKIQSPNMFIMYFIRVATRGCFLRPKQKCDKFIVSMNSHSYSFMSSCPEKKFVLNDKTMSINIAEAVTISSHKMRSTRKLTTRRAPRYWQICSARWSVIVSNWCDIEVISVASAKMLPSLL